jgi:ATP-dependent DNA helicase RecG
LDLATPIKFVKGVGPARALVLESKGLLTVEDLLAYAPFRYEDRSNVKTIAQLAPGELATVVAQVKSSKLSGFRRRNLGLFEASFTDSSRNTLTAKWFHGGYLDGRFKPGDKVALFGKIELDSYTGDLLVMHPEPPSKLRAPARNNARFPTRICATSPMLLATLVVNS